MHAHRGDKVCTNSLLVSQAVLENGLLAALQATVFNPAVLNYVLNSFEGEFCSISKIVRAKPARL